MEFSNFLIIVPDVKCFRNNFSVPIHANKSYSMHVHPGAYGLAEYSTPCNFEQILVCSKYCP